MQQMINLRNKQEDGEEIMSNSNKVDGRIINRITKEEVEEEAVEEVEVVKDLKEVAMVVIDLIEVVIKEMESNQ